jgi:orotate phosphoribosyltransferase
MTDEATNSNRSVVFEALRRNSVKIAKGREPLFELASGAKSNIYVDVKKTAMSGTHTVELAALLYGSLCDGSYGYVDVVAGVVLGGCHLASITAFYGRMFVGARLDVAYVRRLPKKHGTKRCVEDSCTEIFRWEHRRVVLIEDVVTTGGSVLAAMKRLTEVGYTVVGTLAVIDRRPKRTRSLGGVLFKSLFTIDEFLSNSKGALDAE